MSEDLVYLRCIRLWSLVGGSHPSEFRHGSAPCYVECLVVFHLITESVHLLTCLSHTSFLTALVPGSHCLSLVSLSSTLFYFIGHVCDRVYMYVIVCTCAGANVQSSGAKAPQARPLCLFSDNVFHRDQEFAEEAGLP